MSGSMRAPPCSLAPALQVACSPVCTCSPACTPSPVPPPPASRSGAIKGREEGVEELVLAEKIVAHLVKREQVGLSRWGRGRAGRGWQGRLDQADGPGWRAGGCTSFLTLPPDAALTAPAPRPPPPRPPQVLLVVEQPERQPDEPAADFAKRLQNDRVLALNPNYSAE